MKKTAILLAAILSCWISFSFADDAPVADNKTASVFQWPDYQKKWKAAKEVPLEVFVPNRDSDGLDNKYLKGFYVNLGKMVFYLDNEEQPTVVIAEHYLLGNGAVSRSLLIPGMGDWMVSDWQLLVNEKWVSGPPGSKMYFYLINQKKLLQSGKMEGVEVVLDSEDGKTPLSMRVLNKD